MIKIALFYNLINNCVRQRTLQSEGKHCIHIHIHNAVEIDILGIFWRVFIVKNLPPPKKFSGAKLFRANDVISIERVLCFMVCLASWCASLFIYVHEHDRPCFPMLTVETVVFDCICWLNSSRDRIQKRSGVAAEYPATRTNFCVAGYAVRSDW